jgi:hypothetical protein
MIKLRSRQQYALPKSKWELFNKWLCALYEEYGRPISKNKTKTHCPSGTVDAYNQKKELYKKVPTKWSIP